MEVFAYLFFFYTICDTLDDILDHADMISVGFVVPEPHHAPTRNFGVPVDFNNPIVDLFATLFQPRMRVMNEAEGKLDDKNLLFPFLVFNVHIIILLILCLTSLVTQPSM